MAITIESTTLSTYNGASTSSFTVNMPATRPNGDVYLVLAACGGGGALDLIPAAGWTEVGELGNGQTHELAWRNGSSEPATYTWTTSAGTTTFSAILYRISGHDPNGGGAGNPIHKIGVGSTGSDTTTEFDSLTTTIADAMLIGSASGSGAVSITGVPSNYTQDDTTGLDRSLRAFHRLVSATGSYGGTATWDLANNWNSFHVAIAQAPAVPSLVPIDPRRRMQNLAQLIF